jgi:hypothetical protein
MTTVQKHNMATTPTFLTDTVQTIHGIGTAPSLQSLYTGQHPILSLTIMPRRLDEHILHLRFSFYFLY